MIAQVPENCKHFAGFSVIISAVNGRLPPLSRCRDAARWDEFVAAHGGHLLQSSAWGDFKSRFGWRAERWAWNPGDSLRSGAQVLFRRLLPGAELAYVPRGPTLASPDEAANFLPALRDAIRRPGVFLLKLEPDWPRGDPREAGLRAAGFRESPETVQPPATVRIDLTRDENAILAAMKPKWRYNIRLAAKKGVTVRAGEAADLPAFYAMMQVTGARDHFAIHSPQYYRSAFERLAAAKAVRLLVAEYQGQSLAMIFVAAFGSEAIYLYGASSDQDRNLMPNHALHWAALQWAKARGCRWYDLWGIPERAGAGASGGSPLPDSLYQFKRGFGGEETHYSGAWDFVFSPLPHAVYRAVRQIRRGGIV